MAALPAYQQIPITGVAATYGAVTASDTVTPDDRGFLHYINASGGSLTVTVVVPGSTYGQANPDVAVVVGTGTNKFIGPLSAALADPTTGLITVTTSAQTSITVAPIRI